MSLAGSWIWWACEMSNVTWKPNIHENHTKIILTVAKLCFIAVGNIEDKTCITKKTHENKKECHCLCFFCFSIKTQKVQPQSFLYSPIHLKLGQLLMLIMMYMIRGTCKPKDHSVDEQTNKKVQKNGKMLSDVTRNQRFTNCLFTTLIP